MAKTMDPLRRAEAQLRVLTRTAEQTTLHRWRRACAELVDADLQRPSELQGWLRDRSTGRVDEVLRSLVSLAQRGDTVALLAVVVCLAPGIRALARRTGVGVDEAMSEVTLGILEYPVARRRSVAGGLLLDARNRMARTARRTPEPSEPSGLAGSGARVAADPSDPGGELSTAERILALVCEARRRDLVNRDDAQLIVDTRLAGERVAPAAARLGISPQAAYQRRTRAEHRLSTLAVAHGTGRVS